MIHTIKGDITSVERGYIVHGVNCRGVMASGVAKAISDKYPKVKKEYLDSVKFFADHPPDLLGLCAYVEIIPTTLYVVNAFTQLNYGRTHVRYVSYDAIATVFAEVVENSKSLHGESLPICFPKIGAGLGGGDWGIISRIIEKELGDKDGYLYEL